VDDATRETLACDSAAFLHQSLSTPCLIELTGIEKAWGKPGSGRKLPTGLGYYFLGSARTAFSCPQRCLNQKTTDAMISRGMADKRPVVNR